MRTGVAVVAVLVSLTVALVVISNGAAETEAMPPADSLEPEPPAAVELPEPGGQTAPSSPAGPILPEAIEASSQLSSDFSPALLLDGDLTTAWNDASLHGDGATLTFRFAGPVSFEHLTITNLSDPDRFIRNYRLREYAISIDGGAPSITGELRDTPAPQTIELGGARGSLVTLFVVSTFAPEVTNSGPGFEELAVAEVEFAGSVSGEA